MHQAQSVVQGKAVRHFPVILDEAFDLVVDHIAFNELRCLQVFREDPTFRADDAADRAQRIPLSTQQVAEVIERRARADADKFLADARTRATDVIRDAERRATRIIEAATSNAASLEKHMLEMRNHCLKLRAAFEHTAETQLVAARIGIPEASVSERN